MILSPLIIVGLVYAVKKGLSDEMCLLVSLLIITALMEALVVTGPFSEYLFIPNSIAILFAAGELLGLSSKILYPP